MSKLALKGNASGTGTFTLEAPNSNTDRTLTLPDEAGTVLTSASDLSGVTGAGVPDAIDVNASAPADSLAIDSSGNVGVGTSSPISKLSIFQTTASSYPTYSNPASGNGQSFFNVTLNSSDTYNGMLDIGGLTGNTDNANGGSSIRFLTQPKVSPYAAIERMRIDRNGLINIGDTSSLYSRIESNRPGTGGQDHINFNNANGRVGSILTSGSSTSYNTSSDYRLKENVVEMTGAITRVKSLSPKRFNFIADTDDTTVDGFLAHEAQSVVPEAVTGTHDEVDDDGNAVYQGIDQSKLVPLLTGALQEAITKIEKLETTVADLQTRVTALEATP